MSRIERSIIKLFDDLDNAGLLQLKTQTELDQTKFKDQRKRLNNSAGTFIKFKNIVRDENILSQFVQSQKQFAITRDDIITIFWNFMIQRGLDFMEAEKTFFIANLDNTKRLDGQRIRENMTLGNFVVGLDNDFGVPDLRHLLDFEFRNALAHGSYWFDIDGKFTYADSSEIEHHLDIQGFLNKMTMFEGTTDLIFREYISRKP